MVKTLNDYMRHDSKAEVSEEEVMIGLRVLRVAAWIVAAAICHDTLKSVKMTFIHFVIKLTKLRLSKVKSNQAKSLLRLILKAKSATNNV